MKKQQNFITYNNPVSSALNESWPSGKYFHQYASILLSALCMLCGISGSAYAEGLMITGFVVHKTRSQIETNQFQIKTDGDRYNLIVKSPSNELENVEIGCDGYDTYEVRGFDKITKSILKGVVASGLMPSGDIIGNQAIDQILWLAFASGKYVSQKSTNHTNLFPDLVFTGESWLPASRMRIKLECGQLFNNLPTRIEFYCPNYALVSKSQLLNLKTNLPVTQSDVPGEFMLKYSPPFTNGYLIASYKVVQTTNVDQRVIPSEFLFTRFVPMPDADTSNSLIAANIYVGHVQTVSQLGKSNDLLPQFMTGMIQDYRLGMSGGHGGVYRRQGGHWIEHQSQTYNNLLSAYKNRNQTISMLAKSKQVVVAVVLLTFLTFPLILLFRMRRKSRNAN